MKSTSFSSIYAYVGIVLVVLIQLAAGQAQEGNQDITGGEDDGGSIQNGYQSYVNDMNSAASVREAMETLSWASKGSSWMVVSAEATSEEVRDTHYHCSHIHGALHTNTRRRAVYFVDYPRPRSKPPLPAAIVKLPMLQKQLKHP